MTPRVDMWIQDPVTGVFRIATRNEAEIAMGDLPEGVRRRGAWVRDEITGVYRQATRAETVTLYGGMPYNIGEPRSSDRRDRRRRRRRREARPPQGHSGMELAVYLFMQFLNGRYRDANQ
jgi:hypothetical protein